MREVPSRSESEDSIMRSLCSWKLGLALAILVVALLCIGNVNWAQEVTATITGTITDASGGAVVGATGTAKSVERGVSFNATTNEAGIYRLSPVPAGEYGLKGGKQGFY